MIEMLKQNLSSNLINRMTTITNQFEIKGFVYGVDIESTICIEATNCFAQRGGKVQSHAAALHCTIGKARRPPNQQTFLLCRETLKEITLILNNFPKKQIKHLQILFQFAINGLKTSIHILVRQTKIQTDRKTDERRLRLTDRQTYKHSKKTADLLGRRRIFFFKNIICL